MVAIKPQQADSFVANPDRTVRAVLLYGPDAGLVSERGKAIAAKLAARESPPGDVLRLDDADLEGDPDRISVELLTIPMFGGAKVVRTQTGRRVTAASLKPLLEGPPFPGGLVVEAGSLRPDDSLRQLFERASAAAALPCYADEGASLGQLVDTVLGRTGLTITPDARAVLIARLGADRALSRGEIEKLALYAADAVSIDVEHVEAIVGDASEIAIDRVISAAASGDAAVALAECDRAVASGESPQTIVLLTQRYFHRLHRLRVAVETGRSVEQAIGQLRPPLHFKQKAVIERQVRAWTSERLGHALSKLGEAARAARLAGNLEAPITEALLVDLALLARDGQQGAKLGSASPRASR
jgi:DNA polymerase III subunit delta